MLTEREKEYYERQLLLKEMTQESQDKLKEASVLVIGAGGLGCPALIYLATAGVGKIGIVDFDEVSISNLHRQVLYTFNDLGKKKAEIAAKRINKLNPFVKVEIFTCKVEKSNIHKLISQYQVILDCPDNYETRYIVEKAAAEQNKTVIYGSVFCFEGQIVTFKPNTACYYCAFPGNMEGRNQDIYSKKGIFPPITAIIGTIQASEAIKEILDINMAQPSTMCTVNLLNNSVREYQIEKNEDCPICGAKKRSVYERQKYKSLSHRTSI